ncbi:MAG: hypothetical protein WBM04_20915 [Candidatus Korobacteraceae bacterium]
MATSTRWGVLSRETAATRFRLNGTAGSIIEFMPNRSAYVEPRWPGIVAMGAVVALHFSLPEILSFGPNWLLVAVFAVLATFVSISHHRGADRIASVGGLILIASVTAAVITSLVLLIRFLPTHKESPLHLLQSAASLWISNVLVFAAWYWKLDAGGPIQRERTKRHELGAFLFPQMALHEQSPLRPDNWHPSFIDYLFLSFNTSTALSPTDTQILSRWAKALMMLQSLISLTIIVLLAARAVNIL